MDAKNLSEQGKTFLQHILSTVEKWLAEEVKKMCDASSDEEDFLEEVVLYLTRIELKVKALKEESEKIISL